jgi:hypothetical protein
MDRFRTAVGLMAMLGTGCLGKASFIGGTGSDAGAPDAGVPGNVYDPPTGAGALVSEDFPPELLQPYDGPPIDYYDNSFLRYSQLKNRVHAIFADDWVRDNTDQFAAHIAMFGGVDFAEHVNEARGATADYLVALDQLGKDVCSQATQQKSGPFASVDPGDVSDAGARVAALYQKMLFRSASVTEQSDAVTLLSDLVSAGSSPQDAWSGLCEALVHHQDFLFTLAPSYEGSTGPDRQQLLLVRIAQDLMARPPTQPELDAQTSGQKTLSAQVDEYLASNEFRDWFFYRMRVKTQSAGTTDSDEPARLWTYLAMTGAPFADLFGADYTVDERFTKAARPAEHGKTGILTMKGFIAGKPGLPHYTYSARVLGDYLGVLFEVTPAILALRINASASSTTDPNSICFTCHQTLTPLAYQRQRWADDGTYRTVDDNGQSIDDSDHGVVASYAFKGTGIAAFAAQAVRKEAFIRRMFNAMYLLTLGRDLRAYADERGLYKQLWDLSVSSHGDMRQLLKAIILSPAYEGATP